MVKKTLRWQDIHLKALDFGANFLVGYQFSNNLVLKANYTLGIIKY